MTGVLTIIFLISTNTFATARDQLNSLLYKHSVIGAKTVLNPLMNWR